MNEKFMKIKRIAIPAITMIIIASQLFGCAATTQDETLNLIQNNEMIEIEIAVPKEEEQGTQSALTWEILAKLDTYQDTLREPMESILGITTDPEMYWIKHGMLYEDNKGNSVQNNTLKGALQNSDFRAAVDNDEIISKLSEAACNTFVDLEADEEMTNFYMAINAYFNLLPTTEEGYTNPQNVLTRAQFMSLVMRAETECVPGVYALEDFESAVGKSEYNPYAQYVEDFCYLTTADKSLNNMTFNGNISRAESVYMLMNKYFADELENFDMSKVTLEDTKDGGDIAIAQDYAGKDYGKSYELVYSINNPEAGVPTAIYKALAFAESKGFIDSETRYDEATTLEESIELLVNIYKSLPTDDTSGSSKIEVEVPPGGMMTEHGYDYGMTWGELEEEMKDGWFGTVHYYDDNTTYLIWPDGRRFELYDDLPTGTKYTGVTEEDEAKIKEIEHQILRDAGIID